MKNKTKITPFELVLLINNENAIVFSSPELPYFCTDYGIELDFNNLFESKSKHNSSFLSELLKKVQISQKFHESLPIDFELLNNNLKKNEFTFEIVPIFPSSINSKSNIAIFGRRNYTVSLRDEKQRFLTLDGYKLILSVDDKNLISNFSSTKPSLINSKIEIGKTRLQDVLASPICNFINKQIKILDDDHSILEEDFNFTVKSKRKSLSVKIMKFSEGYWLELKDASNQTNKDKELRKFVEELHYNKIISEQFAKELTLVNKKLNASQKQLEEMNLNKDKFFSIVAHDLRSPFSALLGFSEFLAKEAEELTIGEIKDYSSSIHTTGRHLLALLENLLTWSRVQLGRLDFEPEVYDIVDQILTLNNYYIHIAKQKGIQLKSKLPNELNVFADSNMIETVLRNLMTNALKFTPEGGTISVEVLNKQKLCEIRIKDTGVGIPKEDQSKLFKIEAHLTTEGTNKERGSGLGLIICNEFIQKNNGTIEFESAKGKGTTFIIKLPKVKTSKTVAEEKPEESKSKKTSGYKFSK